jgi:3-oxoacyl-[acyl-carrier protein] reductase
MDLGLKNKTVVVTGGTSGIGLAAVELLLTEGANVAFCARNHFCKGRRRKVWKY